MEQEQISIIVLEQEYKIKCELSQIDLLKKSAALLDSKMTDIKKSSPAMTKDKIAVMAALNVVSLYLDQEDELNEYNDVSTEIDKILKSLEQNGIG